jgi:hypothetical protein
VTGTAASGGTGHRCRDDLTIRVFRALYRDYDLHTVAGTHVAVPKGTPWFSGVSVAGIARQISEQQVSADASRPNQAGKDV